MRDRPRPAYEEAFDALFTTLDALEERLGPPPVPARQPEITEADVRLFPTLARFDAVYYLLYKCNLHRLADYQHLWDYARDLYQRPGFGDTTDFVQIKRHYYQTQLCDQPDRYRAEGSLRQLARAARTRPAARAEARQVMLAASQGRPHPGPLLLVWRPAGLGH